MARIDIFGTYHVDRPKKVEDELSEFASEADVIFTERSREEPSTSDWRNFLIRNPALRLTGIILDVIWGLIGFILTREFDSVDASVTRRVAKDRNISIEPVDLSVVRQKSEVKPIYTLFSWLWFLMVSSIFIIGLIELYVPTVTLAIALGFAPVVPLAYSTLDDRDEKMAENIERVILNSYGDDARGCLVVGHKHMDGVIDKLEKRNVKVRTKHKPKFIRRSA